MTDTPTHRAVRATAWTAAATAALLFASLVQASDPRSPTRCELDLSVDRTSPRALTFDRRALPADRRFEGVLNDLINEVEPHRPILIMDTNPNPDRWGGENIVPPDVAAEFPAGRTYSRLTPDERAHVFRRFYERIDQRLSTDERPVLIVDHHLPYPLLADTSTTPLLIDFLTWLFTQPPTFARERVRAAFSHGVIIRDHADADIILASYVARAAARPADFVPHAALFKRAAILNDHLTVDPGADPTERAAAEVLHAWLRAAEAFVPSAGPGAFEYVLNELPAAVTIISRTITRAISHSTDRARPGDADVVGTFLKQGFVPGVDEVWDLARENWRKDAALARRVNGMLAREEGARRVGSVLVMDFTAEGGVPTSAAVARALRDSAAGFARGARVLVTIGRESGRTHVKLRRLDQTTTFDHLLNPLRARDQGGGGRGGAASLYTPAGGVVTEAELTRDVDWLLGHL